MCIMVKFNLVVLHMSVYLTIDTQKMEKMYVHVDLFYFRYVHGKVLQRFEREHLIYASQIN